LSKTDPLHPLYELDTDVSAVQTKPVPVWVEGRLLPGPLYLICKVYFATNIHALDEDDEDKLEVLATTYRVMKRGTPYSKYYRFVFLGTADYRGNPTTNKTLSKNRAQTVADFFKDKLEHPTALGNVNCEVYGEGKKQTLSAQAHKLLRQTPGTRAASSNSMAGWRSVKVYASVPVHEMEAAISKLRKELQKAAEQAVHGHERAIKGAQRLVELYDKRMLGNINSLYGYNLGWLEHHLSRREYFRKRYSELRQAINKGDKAFMNRLRKKSQSSFEQAEDNLKQANRLRRLLIQEMNSVPDYKKEILKEALDHINEVIKQLEIDLKFVEV
jgi:hypothetical protein